jgi:hypothetical protein
MATAKQSEVKWIKKGDIVNGKKATSGYLALRSAPGKAFNGTVTDVKTGSTKSIAGTAEYKNGRNVAAVASRKAAKSGNTASKTSSSSYAKPSSAKGSTGAAGTPLLAASEMRRGLTTRSGATALNGLPRGTVKPKTFVNKPQPKRGEKRSFSGVVKQWNGTAWVPFKK